jgi:hypothetical protein
VSVEKARPLVAEEAVKAPGDGVEPGVENDLVVPLDAALESRSAQIRASDVGDGARAMEKIRPRMKARAVRNEDARVESASGPFLKVEEAKKGVGLGDAEVVAREDSNPASALPRSIAIRCRWVMRRGRFPE